MTAVRFLAFVQQRRGHNGANPSGRLGRLSSTMRLTTIGRTTVALSGGPVLEFPGGAIIGPLFDRVDSRRVRSIDEAEARRIVGSRGERLIERYWGGYVAVLINAEDETVIVRAPFGELPCYWSTGDDGTVCASDVRAIVDAGLLHPMLAWDAVIRELAWRDFRGTETCLSGVAGLRGGERLVIAEQGHAVDALWSPWTAASEADDLSPAERADRLRRHVVACVTARASAYDRVLVLLSGGLDSSIVAASLAQGRTPFSLATMATRDPAGDERAYASAMAHAIGRPLHEAMRDVERIVVDRSTAARLPRPAGRLFEQESMRISEDLAAHVDAQAVMTGGGGDNVFCSLQSAAPVVDRLRAQGPSKGIFDTAREMALLASVSVPTVLWAALGRWVRSGRGSPPEPDLSLLAPAARDVTRATPHRWLVAPSGAHPGKAAHVKLLAAAESFMQGFDPEGDLPTVAPLLAQPVVETCLAIPSWQWFAGGLNRAIARRAFERDLPELIVRRVSKGTPDTFAAEIYERYRVALRERLLGGVLAAERLLDIATVERAFVQSGSLAPANYRRLLRLADVEVWARTWIGRAS